MEVLNVILLKMLNFRPQIRSKYPANFCSGFLANSALKNERQAVRVFLCVVEKMDICMRAHCYYYPEK